MSENQAPDPAQAPAQVLQSCLRDFAAIALEEESELKPTAELVDALIKASTPNSPIGRMRDALAAQAGYPVGQKAAAPGPGIVRCPRCWELVDAPAPQVPVALTPSQIHDLCNECHLDWHRGWLIDEEPNRYLQLARAIEAAHGIPAPQTKEQP